MAELVRRGSITAEEAEHHPHRNVITRALGAEAEVDADVVSTELMVGDVVLLCSDGLSSYVPQATIAEVLAESATLDDAARGLVECANAAGGTDNVTVVLARVGRAEDGGGDTAEAPQVTLAMPVPAVEVAPTLAPIPAVEAAPTTEVRVLGGVRGHAGTERAGGATSRTPQVLEPVRRRRSRAIPILVGGLALLLIAGGVLAWISSRTYGLEEASDGTVVVTHGLGVDVFGRDLAEPWQETGVPAGAVRTAEPGVLSTAARGQGEAVELATRLVWNYGLAQPPFIEAPQAATTPSPPQPEATPTVP